VTYTCPGHDWSDYGGTDRKSQPVDQLVPQQKCCISQVVSLQGTATRHNVAVVAYMRLKER
jgi:hypothetical protein